MSLGKVICSKKCVLNVLLSLLLLDIMWSNDTNGKMSTLGVFLYSKFFRYCTGLILNHEYMNGVCCRSLFFFLLVFKSRLSFSYA
jgi:hypothetical protein